MSKTNKILAYVFAILSLVAAALLYLETSMKGFPDGHLTELDRAERPLFNVLCFLLTISGLFLIYIAWFSKGQNRNVIFYKVTIFLILSVIVGYGLDMYLTSTLENGGGG